MTDRPLDGVLPTDDRAVGEVVPAAERQLSGDPPPVGANPAALTIDHQRHLVGPNAPILEAVETSPETGSKP